MIHVKNRLLSLIQYVAILGSTLLLIVPVYAAESSGTDGKAPISERLIVKDPTRPSNINVPTASKAEVSKKQRRGLKLRGIKLEGNNKVALIDKKQFRIGDKIGAYKVVDIKPWYVDLNFRGKLRRLELTSNSLENKLKKISKENPDD